MTNLSDGDGVYMVFMVLENHISSSLDGHFFRPWEVLQKTRFGYQMDFRFGHDSNDSVRAQDLKQVKDRKWSKWRATLW